MSEDPRALDGNALVARLAVVKKRVLDHAGHIEHLARNLGPTKASDGAADRADTEAVLDQCAARLPEVGRLRGLIRAVVAHRLEHGNRYVCPCCDKSLSDEPESTPESHWIGGQDCPWPALVAEAEKP